jgi:serine/threonine protein kinase
MGNYEILGKLGVGGMGTVYKARHRFMKRVVALKVLGSHVAGSAAFKSRFQREVEAIARLSHPNIVMAFDADEDAHVPFLVMEFVNGRDLATELAAAGTVTVADAVDWVLQAARGLDYAHRKGIIHRDIKPSNLMRDVDGVVKVADLGLARLGSTGAESHPAAPLTRAGSTMGTIEYMAPEQAIDSAAVDHRCDIYSLGCTLYFLLTGLPLYSAPSAMGVLLHHRDSPIPPLAESRDDIPFALERIFRRMVAKNPAARFASMGEVATALEAFQQSLRQPITEPAPTDQAARTAILVEPSRTQAVIIRRYLHELGMTSILVTGTGREAMELARGHQASLMISAMYLPDMTGTQLASAVRADRACTGVQFILATSENEKLEDKLPPDIAHLVTMHKPFTLHTLSTAMEEASGES